MTSRDVGTIDFLPVSPWVVRPADLQPPLQSDISASFAVIGAGYTGLSAALALKGAGADVVLVEREFAGFGASGRNAGHLTPTIGKDLPTLMLFGKRRAAQLVRFADEAVRHVESLIEEHRIECDYVPSGNIMAAVHPKHEARLRHAATVAAQIGAHVRFLSRDEMRARGIPPSFLAGALEESGGALDPGKYVMALRRAVMQAGVPLYEQTAVEEIIDGPQPCIRTRDGQHQGGSRGARDQRIHSGARATAPHRLPTLRHPVRDGALEPVAARHPGLAGAGRHLTAHESLESYRLTARGTILGGSKGVRYPYGSALVEGSRPATLALLERAFRDRFPELGDVKIAHFWGGWIAMTLHFLPALGRTGTHQNIYHAIGYNGHGLAAATAMGAIAADWMLGRKNEHLDTLRRFVPPLPPEPLRWLTIRGVMSIINAVDARIDRQIRAQRAAGR